MQAVSACDATAVRRLLSSDRSIVNFKGYEGTTALMYAAMNRDSEPGALDILRMLLERGANQNTKDSGDNTALHFAAGEENIASVRLLLDKGANPYLRNTAGLSASDVAKEVGARAIAELLEKNMRPSASELVRAVRAGNIPEARFQLERGVSPNTADASGTPLLFVAVNKMDVYTFRLLVSMGADTTAKCGGQDILNYAQFKHPHNWSFCDTISGIIESAEVPSSRDARSAAREIERAHASSENSNILSPGPNLARRREELEEAGRQQRRLRKFDPKKTNVWVRGTKTKLLLQ
ncbi:MAG: ankyrin repeat domain-containing protein [Candidatus Micrarchaeia archaeon]